MTFARRFLAVSFTLLLPAAGVCAGAEKAIHIRGRQVSGTWVRSDSFGYRWDIPGNGTVSDGTNDAYDGGMRLTVNGSSFPTLSTARVNEQNTEMQVGPWTCGSLRVSRRIFVNAKAGYCRWIDIFENTASTQASVTLSYRSNMGEGTQAVHSTSGKSNLTVKDWGVVTAGSTSGSSRPAIAHVFASPGSKFKPRFQFTRGSDDLRYHAIFKIPGKKAVALCFFEAQRRPFAEAVKFLKQFNPRRELRLVPAALRRILLNLRGSVLQLDEIELSRREKSDLVVLRNGDEILGRITNPRFEMKTEFGELTFPPAEVIALVSLPGDDRRVHVVLLGGQVVAGELTNGPIVVRMPGRGELKAPVGELVQAAYQISPKKPEEIERIHSFVVLRCGPRLAFEDKDKTFEFLTPHGRVTLSPADLLAIELDTPQGGLHRAVFRNGSVLAGLLPAERIAMPLKIKLNLDVPRQRVRRFIFAGNPVDSNPMAQLTLWNGDILYGSFADKAWTVRNRFGEVAPACADIAGAAFVRNSPGQVKLTLRSGTKIGGKLAADYVQFKIQPGPTLKIHAGQIESATGRGAPKKPPAPAAPPAPATRRFVPTTRPMFLPRRGQPGAPRIRAF